MARTDKVSCTKEEQKFYGALQNIFVGAKIEGQGGFINLMKIKSRYYNAIKDQLEKDVDNALKEHPFFREELFDKLYSFFSRYFTQNGSIFFNDTAFHNNVYEKVYTNEKDVVLFWKTQMLYYVKTDTLYQSMPIEFDGLKFYFDASNLENKSANEKKSLVFYLKEISDVIHFEVARSGHGSKTKIDEIQKDLKKKNISINEEQLERAFKLFERQSEVDYFINKNAASFLKEQFKLWSYQYFWENAPQWDATRVNQLQILKSIAFKIIDFIAQFEDELVKIWNKPKFVKNAYYVITLDRLSNVLQQKIRKAKGYKEQVKEWKALGIEKDNPKAPVDTKYFEELQLEILAQFDNLDEALDGWLIKSENYQALNTILPKFRERVHCVYIDPPFNLDKTADFEYNVDYKDATWSTFLENRIKIASNFLKKEGSFFLRCDYNGNFIARLILDNIFNKENFKNEIKIKRGYVPKGQTKQLPTSSDSVFFYSKHKEYFNFVDATKPLAEEDRQWISLDMPQERKDPKIRPRYILGEVRFPPQNSHWGKSQEAIDQLEKQGDIRINPGRRYTDTEGNQVTGMPEYKKEPFVLLNSDWFDISGYTTHNTGFKTENSEAFLKRIQNLVSTKGDLVLDFFLGSGTASAVAHKLDRKWIGIEFGNQFYDYALPRMKMILAGKADKEPTKLSRDINWQGGGFFKYYELEQYEESLNICKYEDGDIINHTDGSTYEQYVFLPDKKMLSAIELDYEKDKIQVDLSKLYDNIDIAETISNLTGKWIKSIKKDKVIFTDGTDVNIASLDYQSIKPLIWWE